MKELVTPPHDWQRFDMTVYSDRGPLHVSWGNVLELSKYANMQAGLYIKGPRNTLQLFFENFPKWNQDFWNGRHKYGTFDLPDGARIMDIGCGVAAVDLLLYSYIPNSKFWLLDKNALEWADPIYYSDNYPGYNSWSTIEDAIRTSNFDRNRFTLMEPTHTFPEDLDCVTSYFSWCFHYPKETYWDRAYGALKKGGKLVLDVRELNDRDVIGEITEQMKSKPVLFPYPRVPEHFDAYEQPTKWVMGYRGVWEKK